MQSTARKILSELPVHLHGMVFFILFPVCVSYQLLDPFVTPRVILASAGILLLLLIQLLRKQETPPGTAPVLGLAFWSLLTFLAISALTLIPSINMGDALYEWMKTFCGFSVMFVTLLLYSETEKRILLLKYAQLSMVILSAVYFYQWIYYLNNINLEPIFDLKLHTASTLGNKNFYGDVVCMLLPLALAGVTSLKKFWRILSAINIVLLGSTLLLIQSFAVLLGAGIALPVAAWLLYRFKPAEGGIEIKFLQKKWIAAFLIVAVAAVFAVYKSGLGAQLVMRIEVASEYIENPNRLKTSAQFNSNSLYDRLMLWKNSAEMIKENPLAGAGAGNWKLLYAKYGITGSAYIEEGNVHYEHPHNDLLLVFSESGIAAFIAYILFFGGLAWMAIRGIRNDYSNRVWYAGLLFSVLCFFVISLFSFPRMRFYGWTLLGLQAGLVSVVFNGSRPVRIKKFFTQTKIMVVMLLVLQAWCLYASIIRFDGERHSRILQVAKKSLNYPRMVRESDRASSFYFPVDETATPFSWYKGMALFMSGDVHGAKPAYEDAIQKNPYHIQILHDLATCYEQTNNREKAIELYRRSLEISPAFINSLLNLSACYYNMNQIDSAFATIDKVYGKRVTYQQNKNYSLFLPAILRSKFAGEISALPENEKQRLIPSAPGDTLLTSIYRQSRKENKTFAKILVTKFSAHDK